MKIGELLLTNNVITSVQLDDALSFQYKTTEPVKLGEVLILKGWITEMMLVQFLAQQLGIQVVQEVNQSEVISDILPERVCKELTCILIQRKGDYCLILSDPNSIPDTTEYHLEHVTLALAKVSVIRNAFEIFNRR